ncbi:MAG: response regulator [Anaerolineales bacterium]|nr:response regulator [Anaerolineales bacterium]
MHSPVLLLVEDNAEEALLARRALQAGPRQPQVVVAPDGAEALDLLFATGPHAGEAPLRPSLILLDLNLPRISGLAVLRRLRAAPETALLPVVVLTASQEEHDLLSSYALGANSYLRKPADYQQFVEVVHRLEAYWLTLNEPPPAA